MLYFAIFFFFLVILEKAEELETLKTIIEPREKVLGLWVDTYKQRKHLLKTSLSVQEIFDKYAALSTTLGPDLVIFLDFISPISPLHFCSFAD